MNAIRRHQSKSEHLFCSFIASEGAIDANMTAKYGNNFTSYGLGTTGVVIPLFSSFPSHTHTDQPCAFIDSSVFESAVRIRIDFDAHKHMQTTKTTTTNARRRSTTSQQIKIYVCAAQLRKIYISTSRISCAMGKCFCARALLQSADSHIHTAAAQHFVFIRLGGGRMWKIALCQ